MQKKALKWLKAGKSVGFVPTMGALHEGHLSLVRASKRDNDITVVSIFVNPAQFGPTEDYGSYPRSLKMDLSALKLFSVDAVFIPDVSDIYPEDFQTTVNVGKLSQPMCGKSRPVFFGGVARVVLKLFNLVMPTRAYFGLKDYQQFLIIKQLIKDLNLPVIIVPRAIIREKDGLALSSRNAYLSKEERKIAPRVYAALELGKEAAKSGKNPKQVQRIIEDHLKKNFVIDYVTVADPLTLASLKTFRGKALLAVAVWLGKTRLIDNLLVNQDTH